ncbi:uncharacterized [Tachysurus ichikawai]
MLVEVVPAGWQSSQPTCLCQFVSFSQARHDELPFDEPGAGPRPFHMQSSPSVWLCHHTTVLITCSHLGLYKYLWDNRHFKHCISEIWQSPDSSHAYSPLKLQVIMQGIHLYMAASNGKEISLIHNLLVSYEAK